MAVLRSASTIAAGALWVASGRRVCGRLLVDRAADGDEDEATIATMFLSRGGDDSVDLIRSRMQRSADIGVGLTDVLASQGGAQVQADLEDLVDSEDEAVADRARRALHHLS